MLNNLETIKQTTKESIELLAQIQSDIDNTLKLGLFDDNKTKQKHWTKIKQLLHNEENVLVQIDDIQGYFYSIINELEKIKPTSKAIKQRQQAIDNFSESMKFKECSFASKDELTRVFVEESKKGLIESMTNRLKGVFGGKNNNDNNNIHQPIQTTDVELIIKPDPKYFVKDTNIEQTTDMIILPKEKGKVK